MYIICTRIKRPITKIMVLAVLTVIISISFLSDTMKADAYSRFPGVDLLITQNSAVSPFRILEITADKNTADIGFYIDGQEPFGVNLDGSPMSYQDMLLNTAYSGVTDGGAAARQTAVNTYLTRYQDLIHYYYVNDTSSTYTSRLDAVRNAASTDDAYPLSFVSAGAAGASPYQETYFPTDAQLSSGWKRIDFDSPRKVTATGSYSQVAATETGDYIKSPDTYSIVDETAGTYAENISYFTAAAANNKYDVYFTTDTGITEFGNYKPDGNYIEVLSANGENTAEQEKIDALIKNANYEKQGLYLKTSDTEYTQLNPSDKVEYDSAVTTITSTVDTAGIKTYQIPAETKIYTPEFVAVTDATGTFHVLDYSMQYDTASNTYTGHYASVLKSSESTYVTWSDTDKTNSYLKHKYYQKDENTYTYNEGKGDYNFTYDAAKPAVNVEVPCFWYSGEFVNNNWFVRKVIGVNDFTVEVITMTPGELQKILDVKELNLSKYNLLYIQSSASMAADNEVVISIQKAIQESKLPCIIDTKLGTDPAWASYYATENGTPGSNIIDKDFVNGSIYWCGTINKTVLNKTLTVEYSAEKIAYGGFNSITSYIASENEYLETAGKTGSDLIPSTLSQSVAIQYILSRKSARSIGAKDTLNVLEIEPCRDYYLTNELVRSMSGYDDKEAYPNLNVNIDKMTTSEFIGKIGDLNSTYDFIYVGCKTGLMNTKNGETVFNDADMDGLIYMHTGDQAIASSELIGIMDSDYVGDSRDNLAYSRSFYKLRTYKDENGKLVMDPEDATIKTSSGTILSVKIKEPGVYRYSGNDITEEKMNALLDYLKAGYPVVFATDFFITEGTGNVVNQKHIDNSSYMYEFAKTAISTYKNAFEQTTSIPTAVNKTDSTDSGKFKYYLELPKVVLDFSVDGGQKPADATKIDETTQKRLVISKSSDNNYYLTYTFAIEDAASPSPANTKYSVSLYIDTNADGQFSTKTENMSDIQVTDKNGEAVDPTSLLLGKDHIYTVKRQVPSSYVGLIPWKLVVQRTDNSYARTETRGYSLLDTTLDSKNKQIINILQIVSDSGDAWDLVSDGDFKTLTKNIPGLEICVNSINVSNFNNGIINGGCGQKVGL